MADNEPKENKYKYWKRRTKDQALNLFSIAKNKYYNKYYNLWMSKFKWRGLDEDLKEQEENYIMRKLWSEGALALRNIKNTDMIALCPFAIANYNYLDFDPHVTQKGVGYNGGYTFNYGSDGAMNSMS